LKINIRLLNFKNLKIKINFKILINIRKEHSSNSTGAIAAKCGY